MKKLLIALILIVLLISNLCSCTTKPKGEPRDIITGYFQSLIDGDYDKAYSELAATNKKEITLEQFKDWRAVYEKIYNMKSFKITKEKELKDYKYQKNKYDYAIKFTIILKEKDYSNKKEITSEAEKIIVSEDNKWKVLDEEDYIQKYASSLNTLGWMYLGGQGQDEDPHTAIQYFKQAIDLKFNDAIVYYNIASAYQDIDDDQNAFEYIEKGIKMKQSKENLSDLYNLKGISCSNMNDIQGAKNAYNKALELNPDNTYAKGNLKDLE